jgi:hypothetical protein
MVHLRKGAVQPALRALQSDTDFGELNASANFDPTTRNAGSQETQAQAYAEALDDARLKAQTLATKIGVTLGSIRSVTEIADGGAGLPPSINTTRRTRGIVFDARVALSVTFGGGVPISVVGVRSTGSTLVDPADMDSILAMFDAHGPTHQAAMQNLAKLDSEFRAVMIRFGAEPRDFVLESTEFGSCC